MTRAAEKPWLTIDMSHLTQPSSPPPAERLDAMRRILRELKRLDEELPRHDRNILRRKAAKLLLLRKDLLEELESRSVEADVAPDITAGLEVREMPPSLDTAWIIVFADGSAHTSKHEADALRRLRAEEPQTP